jgi:hypothetical protein
MFIVGLPCTRSKKIPKPPRTAVRPSAVSA